MMMEMGIEHTGSFVVCKDGSGKAVFGYFKIVQSIAFVVCIGLKTVEYNVDVSITVCGNETGF